MMAVGEMEWIWIARVGWKGMLLEMVFIVGIEGVREDD